MFKEKATIKNYGFLPDIVKPEDKILGGLGALPKVVIQPDGNWKDFLPEREVQKKKIDTYNCTAFGTENIVVTFMKRVFGIDENKSERALGIVSGTRPPGNSPSVVLDKVRHKGLIPESDLPFSEEI